MNATLDGRPATNEEAKDGFFHFVEKSGALGNQQVDVMLHVSMGGNLNTAIESLAADGRLTNYQTLLLSSGRGRELVVGPYTILNELGEGGFGKVYRALHQIMKREVALKVINSHLVEDRTVRALFLREVEATTRLVHPNIATAYDANEVDGLLYLAMEYVDGPTLMRWIEKRGPLPVPFAYVLLLQLAEALELTHRNGMLHRDIKPANILLPGADIDSGMLPDPSDPTRILAKVIDFGLARLQPATSSHTRMMLEGADLVGTPEYISPEQARSFLAADIRSDMYSLGCTMYLTLTGHNPFLGATPVETIAAQLQKVPEPLSGRCPNVPPAFSSIIHRLLKKNPADRFQTPAELVAAVRNAMGKIIAPASNVERSGRAVDLAAEIDLPETAVLPAVEMVEVRDPGDPAEAVMLWRRWLAVVAALASGGPCELDEPTYKKLHQKLLAQLRNPTADFAGLFARLESLAEPWLTSRSLENLDRHTLLGLWDACQLADRELQPDVPHSGNRRLAVGLCLGLALLAGVLYLVHDQWHSLKPNFPQWIAKLAK